MYMISCDYVTGCDVEEYSYNLMSTHVGLKNTIENNSSIVITDQEIMYHLSVTDVDGLLVQSKGFNFSHVESCTRTTG